MARPPSNHQKPWSPKEIRNLQSLASLNTPTRGRTLKLRRAPAAVQQKAKEEGIPLMPTNQSPYNRLKRDPISLHIGSCAAGSLRRPHWAGTPPGFM